MFGFGGVEVGKDSVPSGEFSGGHEGAGEDVFLLHLGDVEENREAFSVEQNDDVWVGGNERSRWHVGAEHGGVVLLLSGFEELFAALVVEVVEAVPDGSEEGEAVIAGDFAEGKHGGFGRWWGL